MNADTNLLTVADMGRHQTRGEREMFILFVLFNGFAVAGCVCILAIWILRKIRKR